MAIDVYFCEKCGLAFQVETAEENDSGGSAADSGAEESAPQCPRCEYAPTTRMYRMPTQAGGCSPAGGC